MSGICGAVALDGASPGRAAVLPILEALERRGPGGSKIWSEGPAALGHALLATTPESLVETLPLRHADSDCAITADARLDNRGDLLATFGLANEGRTIGDGELILRAYLKWGESCPEQLLGDFAFAIWDGGSRRLFCARDQMGMRQLAYCHLPGRLFAFATEVDAVLKHPGVPRIINDGRIADFLDGLEASSLTETFYSAIIRLAPGHCLALDSGGLAVWRYWELRVPEQLRLKSDEEYAEGFLDVFTKAVDARLRSAGPVGAMLSGGIDSASVSAVAADLLGSAGRGPLPTFSVVGPDPVNCIETRAIREAAEMAGITPNLIDYADLGERKAALVRLTHQSAEPFDGYMGLPRAAYLDAHRAGIKVMLDGVAGDVVLGSSTYIAQQLRHGRVLIAWREARGERDFWGAAYPAWKGFARGAWRAWIPNAVRAARQSTARAAHDRRIGRSGLIARAFAERADLHGRRRRQRERDAAIDRLDERDRVRRIVHPNLTVGRERYDRVASGLAIEPRDPFMDLRVIRYCLSVPLGQLRAGGWPKSLLRRAMRGRVPDGVRWRRGRQHLGRSVTRQLLSSDVEAVLDPRLRETIAPFIHLAKLPASPSDLANDEHCKAWTDAICLYHWLESAVAVPGRDVSFIGGIRS